MNKQKKDERVKLRQREIRSHSEKTVKFHEGNKAIEEDIKKGDEAWMPTPKRWGKEGRKRKGRKIRFSPWSLKPILHEWKRAKTFSLSPPLPSEF